MKKHNNVVPTLQQATTKKNMSVQTVSSSLLEISAEREPVQLTASAYIKIDHATLFDNIAIIAGWCTDDISIKYSSLLESKSISRPDASLAAGQPATGFVVVLGIANPVPTINIHVETKGKTAPIQVRFSTTAEMLTRAMQHYALHSQKFIEYYVQSRLFSKYLASTCALLPSTMRATDENGHIDMIRAFPGYGYVAYGWALTQKNCSFWLLSSKGDWFPLNMGMWFNRQDVADSFAESFGPRSSEAGFFCSVKNLDVAVGSTVRLIAASEQGLFVVHEAAVTIGPQTPLGYARWAFTLSIPSSRFFERLASQDGELIDKLIASNRAGYPNTVEVWETEGMPQNPAVSVVVPLYGRADFVEYQLTKFCKDQEFLSGNAELIYVIDDPRLVEGLRQSCHQLTKLYKVPFKVVWGKINRGYSGANNLGISHARAETVILLNSDVFPLASGWSKQMAETLLSSERIGAVGARLEYADGSIQHQGMVFDFSPEWQIWLNKHPGQGFANPPRDQIIDVEAATGACLAVRRRDLEHLGGLDEGFLIGDFEDSDLCLKLRAHRGRIVVLAKTRLVHLERQSFSQLGSHDFRTNVVKYNAWRHSCIWGSAIAALKEEQ